MVNEHVARGKWDQAKGDVKERWGEITDDEYRQTEGKIDQLAGLIVEKYGAAKEEVTDFFRSLSDDDENDLESRS